MEENDESFSTISIDKTKYQFLEGIVVEDSCYYGAILDVNLRGDIPLKDILTGRNSIPLLTSIRLDTSKKEFIIEWKKLIEKIYG